MNRSPALLLCCRPRHGQVRTRLLARAPHPRFLAASLARAPMTTSQVHARRARAPRVDTRAVAAIRDRAALRSCCADDVVFNPTAAAAPRLAVCALPPCRQRARATDARVSSSLSLRDPEPFPLAAAPRFRRAAPAVATRRPRPRRARRTRGARRGSRATLHARGVVGWRAAGHDNLALEFGVCAASPRISAAERVPERNLRRRVRTT